MTGIAIGGVRLRNYTPHDITLHLADGAVIVLPRDGTARVDEHRTLAFTIGDVPVHTQQFREVRGLPEPVDGTYLVVSSVVLHARNDRGDLIAPDTGAGAVRGPDGRIVGTTGFVMRADAPR